MSPTETRMVGEGITVKFGGLVALNNVSIDVPRATITGLIGPNGAGKSTLFNVLTGMVDPVQGRVLIGERDVTHIPPHHRARLGVARTFQRLALFGSMTVRDNVLVTAELNRRHYGSRSEMHRGVDDVLERLGLTELSERQAATLPTGSARLLEVARALVSKPDFVLLDEPSAGLDNHETDRFGQLVVDLAESGVGVLIVEHDVGLVMEISSRIFVLDFGTLIASGEPAEVKADRAVQEAYLGTTDVSPAVTDEMSPAASSTDRSSSPTEVTS